MSNVGRELQAAHRALQIAAAMTDDEWDKALLKQLRDTGGFTFRDEPGDGPTNGYMVSQTPDRKIPADEFHPRMVRDFRDDQRGELDANPGDYIGGWNEDDGIYVERSRNHPKYNDAIGDAYDKDQIALRDLGYNTDIDTAATQYNGEPGIYMASREEDWWQI